MNCRFIPIGLCLVTLLGAEVLRGEEPRAVARRKSVTIFPVVITHSQKVPVELPTRIAEVLGLFLEEAGMKEIKIGEKAFSPPDTNDVSQIAAAFGQFVAKQPLKTEYAVLGHFLGGRETSVKEIRTVVVDKAGKVIFAERADQQHFSRSKIKPKDPMTCTLFVASRLREVWALGDPQRKNAPKGKSPRKPLTIATAWRSCEPNGSRRGCQSRKQSKVVMCRVSGAENGEDVVSIA